MLKKILNCSKIDRLKAKSAKNKTILTNYWRK